MQVSRFQSLILLGGTLALASSVLGCNAALTPTAAPSTISVTGNWQVASNAAAASRLPSLSGELTGSGNNITGIFHSNTTSSCVAPAAAFELAGKADAKNNLTLTGPVAGGTLTLNGTLAADGKSVSNASYNVTGGSCAFAQAAPASAQSYSSISGNYAGSFSDPDGRVLTISQSTLTQTPASDTDGNFQLSGSATLPGNPCFNSPVQISASQVTGGSFTLTYSDPNTMNSVTAAGTFSTDGSTLNVTNWQLSGSCGPDSGTGLLTKQ